MKRIIIIATFFISFVNAFSQENEDRIIENNDSIYINDETISKTINTDKAIIVPIDPTVSSWVNNNGFLYYNGGNVGIGTSTPSYKLQTQGDIYANGGWLRVSGTKGLYFESYGGGFYMNDATWIRTYNNKSFFHSSGIMRTDGTFQVGSDGSRFIVNTAGNVGIGVTNPLAPLHIDGKEGIWMQRSTWTPVKVKILLSNYTGPTGGLRFMLTPDGNWVNYKDVLFLSPLGRVGIGTTDPQSELSVNGKILAKEVEVTLEGWSDFVFEKDYNLMSIKELELYIDQNKHLPDVPNEDEVKENGVNLGNMDKVLLQKIEELTLYIIQLENRIAEIENK